MSRRTCPCIHFPLPPFHAHRFTDLPDEPLITFQIVQLTTAFRWSAKRGWGLFVRSHAKFKLLANVISEQQPHGRLPINTERSGTANKATSSKACSKPTTVAHISLNKKKNNILFFLFSFQSLRILVCPHSSSKCGYFPLLVHLHTPKINFQAVIFLMTPPPNQSYQYTLTNTHYKEGQINELQFYR